MTYKYESVVIRKVEREIKNPIEPLTSEEKERLRELYQEDFMNEYAYWVRRKGTVSDDEMNNFEYGNKPMSVISTKEDKLLHNDLRHDGWLFFINVCLEKFDKSIWKNKIADRNYPGPDAPKTLDWFFNTNCRQLLQWHIRDVRKKMVKRNIEAGGVDCFNLGDIDTEDFTAEQDNTELTLQSLAAGGLFTDDTEIQSISNELKGDPLLVKFFYMKFTAKFTNNELLIEFGEQDFKRLNQVAISTRKKSVEAA